MKERVKQLWSDFVQWWVMKAVPVIRVVGRPVFNLYVAVNMLLCAVIFFPWAQPRETISGFLGRMTFKQHYWAWFCAKLVDKLYFWEEAHCGETAISENEARLALYPHIDDSFN